MLNEPEIVKIEDKDYKVEGFTQVVQEAFERMMEAKFLEVIKTNKEKLADDYLPLIQKFFFDVKKGDYKFLTPNFYTFINSEENFLELLHWCFSKHQVTDKQVLKVWLDREPELAINLFERLLASAKKN